MLLPLLPASPCTPSTYVIVGTTPNSSSNWPVSQVSMLLLSGNSVITDSAS
jgi:hypothetical protein